MVFPPGLRRPGILPFSIQILQNEVPITNFYFLIILCQKCQRAANSCPNSFWKFSFSIYAYNFIVTGFYPAVSKLVLTVGLGMGLGGVQVQQKTFPAFPSFYSTHHLHTCSCTCVCFSPDLCQAPGKAVTARGPRVTAMTFLKQL